MFQIKQEGKVPLDRLCGKMAAWPQELSFWEDKYKNLYEVDVLRLRRLLDNTMVYQETEVALMDSIRYRYYNGIFDSVGKFFRVGKFLVPNLAKNMPNPVNSVPFVESMCMQDEYKYDSRHYGDYKEMTIADVQTFDMTNPRLVMREKINGTPFFLGTYGDKKILMGACMWAIVPDWFTVSMVELHCGDFYIIRPFAVPEFYVDAVRFLAHAWEPVRASNAAAYEEGVFFLKDGEEWRVKKNPTIEVDASKDNKSGRQGVWECMLVGKIDNYILKYLVPRPGKKPIEEDPINVLLRYVSMSVLEWPVLSEVEVITKVDGPFVGGFLSDGSTVVIDSGLRLEHGRLVPATRGHAVPLKAESVVLHGDIFNYRVGDKVEVRAYPDMLNKRTVTGVKLLLFDAMYTYLIKDDDKMLDMVGGKIEIAESSTAALVREIREETGWVCPIPAVRVALTIESTGDANFATVLYIAPVPEGFPMAKMRGVVGYNYDAKESVPWIDRLYEAVVRVCPDFSKIKKYFDSLEFPMRTVPKQIRGADTNVGAAYPPCKWDRYLDLGVGRHHFGAAVARGKDLVRSELVKVREFGESFRSNRVPRRKQEWGKNEWRCGKCEAGNRYCDARCWKCMTPHDLRHGGY